MCLSAHNRPDPSTYCKCKWEYKSENTQQIQVKSLVHKYNRKYKRKSNAIANANANINPCKRCKYNCIHKGKYMCKLKI